MKHALICMQLLCTIAIAFVARAGGDSPQTPGQSGAPQPNVVVIVADDLGWNDVGYHGGTIPTPHLDSMAGKGIQLDRFYVAAMCTPTRAAFLTGKYWSRFGNTNPSNAQVLPFGTTTLAGVMQASGYRTALIGKWHLGSSPDCGPGHFGFGYSYGSLAGGVAPWIHTYKRGSYSQTWHRNHEWIFQSGHVTDLITREALEFLARSGAEPGPLFLYVPFSAVHHPIQEPDEWIEKASELVPDRIQYAASVMHLDHCIGKILEGLEKLPKERETVVLFFSDNGGMGRTADGDNRQYAGAYAEGEMLGSNHPLRGHKQDPYEGGIRVPAMIYSPSWLEPRKIRAPIHVIDLFPTLLSLAGIAFPAGESGLDGMNRHDLLLGLEEDHPENHPPYYWLGISRKWEIVLHYPWKWISYPPDSQNSSKPDELYNLALDPAEKRNLSQLNHGIIERLSQVREHHRSRNDESRP